MAAAQWSPCVAIPPQSSLGHTKLGRRLEPLGVCWAADWPPHATPNWSAERAAEAARQCSSQPPHCGQVSSGGGVLLELGALRPLVQCARAVACPSLCARVPLQLAQCASKVGLHLCAALHRTLSPYFWRILHTKAQPPRRTDARLGAQCRSAQCTSALALWLLLDV